MNNKYDFLAGIFYILFMLFTIILGICGIIFGQNHRPDIDLIGIFLIIAPTIDLTRRFTIAWIYVKMEEENDEDNDEIK
jgi:quinol-cytochrome oxidoreductase complex cytochrome b subunit